MEDQKEKTPNNFFILALLSCSIISIATSFYFYYFKKDFNLIVEVACDSTQETCFQRDCSSEGNCPPNNLSKFKRYSLNAGDFKMCEKENCANACKTGEIKCEQVECEEDLEVGESCSSFEGSNTN